MKKALKNRIKWIVTRLLPDSTWADAIVSVPQYIRRHRRIPRLVRPRLFTEHLLRLKLDGTLLDPLRQYVTDKEYVKHYIAGLVGQEYALETYEILRSAYDVHRLELKRVPCVVKPTHMSGEVLFYVDNHARLDAKLMTRWLRTSFYKLSREANYRFLKPKIIVEEFFSVDGKTPPSDYKIFCFFGHPILIQVDSDRFRYHTRNYYDVEWNRVPIEINYPSRSLDDARPNRLGEMLDVARELSSFFSSIRIDMYTNGDIVKVGELTSCHESAGSLIQPRQAELWLGELFSSVGADGFASCIAKLRGTGKET